MASTSLPTRRLALPRGLWPGIVCDHFCQLAPGTGRQMPECFTMSSSDEMIVKTIEKAAPLRPWISGSAS